MKKPGPIRKDSLRHPKDKLSAFNGDKWRNEKRDNYTSRVSTTTGSRPPSNVKEVQIPSIGSPQGRDRTGAIKPPDRNLSPTFVADPTPRQQAMTYAPKKRGSKR